MRSSLLILSISLYVACLPLNSFCVQGICKGWPGWGVLVFGAIGLSGAFADLPRSLSNLTWFANPALFIGWWGTYWRLPIGRWFSTIAVILAAAFLLAGKAVTSESGSATAITGYGAGYWLWLASAAAGCLAAFWPKGRRDPAPATTGQLG